MHNTRMHMHFVRAFHVHEHALTTRSAFHVSALRACREIVNALHVSGKKFHPIHLSNKLEN